MNNNNNNVVHVEMCPLSNGTRNDHVLVQFGFFVNGLLLTILTIFGVVSNILTVIVYLQPIMWASLNYYMITLALWDLILLISAWPMFSLTSLVFDGQMPEFGNWVHMYVGFYSVGNIAAVGCVWISVTITLERFLAICFPLRHRTFNNMQRAKTIVVSISVLAIIYTIPRCFELSISECVPFDSNKTQAKIGQSVTADSTYFLVYRIVCWIFFVTLGPFVVMLALTFRMIVVLRKATIKRQKLSYSFYALDRSSKHQKKRLGNQNTVNYMLITVLIKFLICYSVTVISDLLEHSLEEKFNQDEKYNYIVSINNFLVMFNSATNILVYCWYARKFRLEIMRLFCCQSESIPNFNLLLAYDTESEHHSQLSSKTSIPLKNNNNNNCNRSSVESTLTPKSNGDIISIIEKCTLTHKNT